MSLVLIVDDEPDVRLMLRMALMVAGHDVSEAADGDTALHRVGDEDFDAIVLDIHLPDMLGWEVLARIHRAPDLRRIPVVVVTADVSQADTFALEHEGEYFALLHKPLDPDDLVDAIERAMATA